MTASPRVSVVIVNHQTPDEVESLVRDLARQERVILDCVCVDTTNDVDDSLCASILGKAGFTWRLVHSDNIGYGAANNLGLSIARESHNARWAIVSNPDIELHDTLAIRHLQHALAEQRPTPVWIAGPRILTADGRPQNPYLTSDLVDRRLRAEKLKHLWPVVSHVFQGLQVVRYTLKSLWTPVRRTSGADVSDHKTTQKVFAVHGSFFLADMESLSVAGAFPPFDERIFLYCEEIALAKRVLAAGGAEVYVPSVEVIHKEDASNRSRPATRTLIKTLRQHQRSRRMILREYY